MYDVIRKSRKQVAIEYFVRGMFIGGALGFIVGLIL